MRKIVSGQTCSAPCISRFERPLCFRLKRKQNQWETVHMSLVLDFQKPPTCCFWARVPQTPLWQRGPNFGAILNVGGLLKILQSLGKHVQVDQLGIFLPKNSAVIGEIMHPRRHSKFYPQTREVIQREEIMHPRFNFMCLPLTCEASFFCFVLPRIPLKQLKPAKQFAKEKLSAEFDDVFIS